MEESKFVVFEHTELTGGSHGMRTIGQHNRHESAQAAVDGMKGTIRILAEGLTKEEADAMVRETPVGCRLGHALELSKEADGGINAERLLSEILAIRAIYGPSRLGIWGEFFRLIHA